MIEILITTLFRLCLAVLLLVMGSVIFTAAYFILSLPYRRRDRAGIFLDLLELSVDRGNPLEQAFLSAAETHDAAMGASFYFFAAHIEMGESFQNALKKVPGFLPPQVSAILQTGVKLGDLKKVLPAAREYLRAGTDTKCTNLAYLFSIMIVFAPVCIWIVTVTSIYVIPKLSEIQAGYGFRNWPFSQFIFSLNRYFILGGIELMLFLFLAAMAAFFIGGPQLVRVFQFRKVPLVDWITWKVPWKRKKLLRTYSAMLAVLLDGGAPEVEAVILAGHATANEICRRRSQRVAAQLEGGVKLEEAIRVFDNTGEFHWRLSNAGHAHRGFMIALNGWHEALDAKALQQEETAVHAFLSGLVLLNGLVVGLVAIGTFGMLVMFLRGMLENM